MYPNSRIPSRKWPKSAFMLGGNQLTRPILAFVSSACAGNAALAAAVIRLMTLRRLIFRAANSRFSDIVDSLNESDGWLHRQHASFDTRLVVASGAAQAGVYG